MIDPQHNQPRDVDEAESALRAGLFAATFILTILYLFLLLIWWIS